LTGPRLDHVVVVVHDMAGAIAFFQEIGLEIEGAMPIEGDWVDRVNGITGIRAEITMLRTPDGHGKLELTTYDNPAVPRSEPQPPNTVGLRSVMFEVDDIDDVVARLRAQGGELMGEIVQYENVYRLCYVRGPGGIIVALAQQVG
jgi:catechol 2,3-dioxygenase-like lactoylglutathione lyase family enzyme